MVGAEVWSLLVQIPLVGIFVWFALQQQKIYSASQNSRDAEWRDFLREEREANNTALGRIAEEVKCSSTILSAMKDVIVAHDQRVQLAIPEMREIVEKLKTTGKARSSK